jgi:hypothetical protein
MRFVRNIGKYNITFQKAVTVIAAVHTVQFYVNSYFHFQEWIPEKKKYVLICI